MTFTQDIIFHNVPINVSNLEMLQKVFPTIEIRDKNPNSDFVEFTLDGVVGYAITRKWCNEVYTGNLEQYAEE